MFQELCHVNNKTTNSKQIAFELLIKRQPATSSVLNYNFKLIIFYFIYILYYYFYL